MSVLRRACTWLSDESVLLCAVVLAIFYGNIYGSKLTVPLSIILLPLLAIRLRVMTVRWQALLPVLACSSVLVQALTGHVPLKADITVYFCFFYSLAVVVVFSRAKLNYSLAAVSIVGGCLLLGAQMIFHAWLDYRPGLKFYEMKNLIATPLGSSNYLAVFILFGIVVALYARIYLCVAALLCLFLLTFSRTGYGMLVLAIVIWLIDTRTPIVSRWPRTCLSVLAAFVVALVLGLFFTDIALPESLAIRVSLWHAAVDQLVQQPLFGVPRSEFSVIFDGKAWDPHNSILHLMLLLGGLGTFIYLVYIGLMVSLFARLSRDSVFWRSILVGVLVTLVWSLFEVVLLTPAYDILLAVMFGWALCAKSVPGGLYLGGDLGFGKPLLATSGGLMAPKQKGVSSVV